MHSEPGQTGLLIPSQGYTLLGNLFLGKGSHPKPTALLLHGIPGIEKNYDLAHALRNSGWNAAIFHYRGCWGSGGSYSITTIPGDVSAAIDTLSRGDFPVVDPQRIIAIGHSLGGWAAVLAARRDRRVKALCSIGGVSDPKRLPLSDPAFAKNFSPWLSGVTAGELAAQWGDLTESEMPLIQAPFLNQMPTLILHGSDDVEVDPQHSLALSAALTYAHELEIVPNADHSFTWQRPWLQDRILAWCAGLF